MSFLAPATSGAKTTRTGTPRSRSCLIDSGGLKLLPPAITRSVPSATIFSTSTEPNLATSGMPAAASGYGLKSSTLPTIRSPTPSANRVSVAAGVRDTIFVGSAGMVAEPSSSSVSSTGKRGASVGRRRGGRGRGDRGGRDRGDGGGRRRRGGCSGGRRAGGDDDGQHEAGQGEEGAGRTCVHGNSDSGWENRRPLASGVEAGVRQWIARLRLTFLSKARAATAGRRPDFRPRGRSP